MGIPKPPKSNLGKHMYRNKIKVNQSQEARINHRHNEKIVLRQLHLKKAQELMSEYIEIHWATNTFTHFQQRVWREINKWCKELEEPQAKRKQKAMLIHITKGRWFL